MKVLRGLPGRPAFPGGTAVAIGNFDGLHIGHRKILQVLVDKAQQMGLASLVLTFSPHPEKVLEGGRIGMIQTLDQRMEGIRDAGVTALLLASFDRAFAGLTAAEFAGRVLGTGLRARVVVVGENFRFGKSRQGDIHDLSRFGRTLGFAVNPVAPAIRNGQVVSSSLIRHLLNEGRIPMANRYLGRPYEIAGRVVRGCGRGRRLGFPTANVRPFNEILPKGVFFTAVEVLGHSHPSLTNIGHRPTFGGGRLQVEVHIFDFEGALYRRGIRIRFLRKVRGEKRFSDAEEFSNQVQKDIAAARAFFGAKRAVLRDALQVADD